MIERLQQALEHVEELAEHIARFQHRRYGHTNAIQWERHLAGVWHDLPDDMEDTLLHWRRESGPTRKLDFGTAR